MKNLVLILVIVPIALFSQNNNVGIGTATPKASAALDIESADKGLLIPRVNLVNITNSTSPISSPETGLLVWNTNGSIGGTTNGIGFYYFDGTTWQSLVSSSAGYLTEIHDNNNDTYVRVEETPDVNRIQLKVGNSTSLIELKEVSTNRLNLAFLNTSGDILIGEDAGKDIRTTSQTRDNILIGVGAGTRLRGNQNVILGKEAGVSPVPSTSGSQYDNVILGYQAAGLDFYGTSNIAIGSQAGYNIKGGYNNTYIGYQSGFAGSGVQNVALGYQAGQNSVGSKNVFIGRQAGRNELSDNKLYIDNSSTTTPLIYGDFLTNVLRVNGTLEIGTAYSFPLVDGLANQVLQTDGAGNIGWATIPGLTQVLQLNGNVLSLTNNGGSVTLNPLVDNLGNHVATQNVELNDNWISNDGDNEGIKVADDGKVKIGTGGTFVSEIIKVVVSLNVSSISGNGFQTHTVTVAGALPRGTVSISPASVLPAKVLIASARVSANNTVMIKFVNPGKGSQDPNPMNYYITVINE